MQTFTLESVFVPMDAKLMVKKPNRHRASFSIHLVTDNGCPKLSLIEVDQINKKFKNGTLGLYAAIKLVDGIKNELYRIRDTNKNKSSEENLAIVKSFISETYPKWKIRRMDETSYINAGYDYKRVCRALGDLSLLKVSREDLQDCLDDYFESWWTHKRSVECANNLMSFLGRNVEVEILPKPETNVAFHNATEFKKAVSKLDHDIDRAICGVAFYGGFREGEACGFGKHQTGSLSQLSNSRNFQISIVKQLKRNLTYGPTKNRRKRNALYYGEGEEYMRFWYLLPEAEKKKVRTRSGKRRPNTLFKEACKKVGVPVIRFHDLRHSYAVQLLNDGLPIKVVADMIGDSVSCCENHYTGKVRDTHTIEAVGKMIELNRENLNKEKAWWE